MKTLIAKARSHGQLVLVPPLPKIQVAIVNTTSLWYHMPKREHCMNQSVSWNVLWCLWYRFSRRLSATRTRAGNICAQSSRKLTSRRYEICSVNGPLMKCLKISCFRAKLIDPWYLTNSAGKFIYTWWLIIGLRASENVHRSRFQDFDFVLYWAMIAKNKSIILGLQSTTQFIL